MPPLKWEVALWHWYRMLQAHVLTRDEPYYSTEGFQAVERYRRVPYALDRAVWWPLIEKEQWSHRVAMKLLERMDEAIFGKLPSDTPSDTPSEPDDD